MYTAPSLRSFVPFLHLLLTVNPAMATTHTSPFSPLPSETSKYKSHRIQCKLRDFQVCNTGAYLQDKSDLTQAPPSATGEQQLVGNMQTGQSAQAERKPEQRHSGNFVSKVLHSFNSAVNCGLERVFEGLGRFVGRRPVVVIIRAHSISAHEVSYMFLCSRVLYCLS